MRSIVNPVSLHENQGLTLNRGSFVVSARVFLYFNSLIQLNLDFLEFSFI
jgi:hypothetical protein